MKINKRTKFLLLLVLSCILLGVAVYINDPHLKFDYISFILSLALPLVIIITSLVVFFLSYFLMLDKKKASIRLRQINAWSAILFGIMLVIWPFFLITDPYQYPKCVAIDVAGRFGESGDLYKTRYFLISGSMALIGAVIISIAICRLKKWTLSWKRFGILFVMTIAVVIISFFAYAVMTFTLSPESCGQYNYRFNTVYEDYRSEIIERRSNGLL